MTDSFSDFWNTHDETKARLRIWGFECSPDEITKKLGLKPWQTRVKGEPLRPDKQSTHQGKQAVHKVSLWAYEDDLDELLPPEDHLIRLLELLEPHRENLKNLTGKYETQICLEGYHERFHVGFLVVSPKLLRQIANLNATLEIDLYVLTVDHDAPFRRQYFSEAVGEGSSGELLFKPKTALEILEQSDRAQLTLKGLQFWRDTLGNFSSEMEWVPYMKDEYTQEQAFNDATKRLKSKLPAKAKYVSIWLRDIRYEQHISPHLHDVGKDGNAWTRQQLGDGLGISKRVLSSRDIDSGQTFVAIATDAHEKAALNHNNLENGVSTTRKIITEEQAGVLLKPLHKLARQFGPLSIVAENDSSGPKDARIFGYDPKIERRYQIAGYNEGSPQFVHRIDITTHLSNKQLDYFLNNSTGAWLMNAFVVPTKALGEPPKPNEFPVLSDKVMDSIAKSVVAIINFAYDHESYSIWLSGQSE